MSSKDIVTSTQGFLYHTKVLVFEFDVLRNIGHGVPNLMEPADHNLMVWRSPASASSPFLASSPS